MHTEVDVIVIGGGPAGSTTAGLLAKSGRSVLLLEKEKFPRYHIGESLVPGLIPVLEELGVAEAVERAGFMRKWGITMLWGAARDPWTVRWNESGPYDYVYQVQRADFDHLLLQHSRQLGATVVEEAHVDDVVFEDGRCVGVGYTVGGSPVQHQARARCVVDAAGQARILARRLGLVHWHEDLKNIAVWTYYQGGEFFDGIDRGNILIENHPDGWIWVIPFSDGSRSVGFVGPSAGIARSGMTPEEILEAKLAGSREAKGQLAGATRVADYRSTKDWSYTCTRFAGPGYLITGDAAAFIDPLFSTGVMLAMKAASSAARTVEEILDDPYREAELQQRYEQSYRTFLDVVLSFVRYFYDASKDRQAYFREAKSLIDPIGQMEARGDFVLLVSGLNAVRPILGEGDPLPARPIGVIESADELARARANTCPPPVVAEVAS